MEQRRLAPIAGCAWEAVRFFLLVALVLQVLGPTSPDPYGLGLWLLFLAAPQLVVPACLLFLALHPDAHGSLINPLRVSKLLASFTGLLLLVTGTAFGTSAYPFRLLGLSLHPAVAVLAVLAVDSLILVLLVLWKRGTPPHEEPRKEEPALPAYSETEVKGAG